MGSSVYFISWVRVIISSARDGHGEYFSCGSMGSSSSGNGRGGKVKRVYKVIRGIFVAIFVLPLAILLAIIFPNSYERWEGEQEGRRGVE